MLFVVTPHTPYRRTMVKLDLRAGGCELVLSFPRNFAAKMADLRLTVLTTSDMPESVLALQDGQVELASVRVDVL